MHVLFSHASEKWEQFHAWNIITIWILLFSASLGSMVISLLFVLQVNETDEKTATKRSRKKKVNTFLFFFFKKILLIDLC